jgi:hypothetical protein
VPDFSVKPAPDVDSSLQLSAKQNFTTNSKNPRVIPQTERFARFNSPLSFLGLAQEDPVRYAMLKSQLMTVDKILMEIKLAPSIPRSKSNPEIIDEQ